MEELELMLKLCELNAHRGAVKVSLEKIGKTIRCSKQTVARKLERLERVGYIKKEYLGRGQKIRVTKEGLGRLREIHACIAWALEGKPREVVLEGRVINGLGEGRYYMRQEGYWKRFQEELGFLPYPGTLDIKINPEFFGSLEELKGREGGRIDGFEAGGRTFGAVKFFPARLGRVKGALVFPERGHHRDVIEFIASRNLRQTLGLKNGDEVRVVVLA
jgi:riboflavin kinase